MLTTEPRSLPSLSSMQVKGRGTPHWIPAQLCSGCIWLWHFHVELQLIGAVAIDQGLHCGPLNPACLPDPGGKCVSLDRSPLGSTSPLPLAQRIRSSRS